MSAVLAPNPLPLETLLVCVEDQLEICTDPDRYEHLLWWQAELQIALSEALEQIAEQYAA
jgi:hypothetical protein